MTSQQRSDRMELAEVRTEDGPVALEGDRRQ